MTSGIDSAILRKLKKTLVKCELFTKYSSLCHLFIDNRISEWRFSIPKGENPREQVNAVIASLFDKYNNESENALVLFLTVLYEDTENNELLDLAERLKSCQRETTPLEPAPEKDSDIKLSGFNINAEKLVDTGNNTSKISSPTCAYTDISIRINQKQEQGYPVELTYDLQTFTGALAEDILEAGPSGQKIFDSLFKDKLLEAWNRVKDRHNKRIRLYIDENVSELHTVPWELMCEGNLANIPFSRYIPSETPWPSETLKRPLKVLVIISNPHDLEQKYNNLPAIDLEKEKSLLEEAGKSLPAVQLEFIDEPVTLERVNDYLRNNEYHIIHYIGNAVFNKDKEQAVLYFQDAYGNTKRILSDEFFNVLNNQSHKPRLVFLSACNTGEPSNTTGFRNLGIELVKAGIPAVVAMQNSISMESSREFNRVFYQQLLTNDGIVDEAVSVARNALRIAKRTDVSVPILFARL